MIYAPLSRTRTGVDVISVVGGRDVSSAPTCYKVQCQQMNVQQQVDLGLGVRNIAWRFIYKSAKLRLGIDS